MSEIVERLIAARDRIKPLTRYGEDAVWRPAQNAHECMADAANALADLVGALQTARAICRSAFKDTGMEWDDEAMSRIDAALQKAAALPPSQPLHASDCAIHNAPALPVGPCDCNGRP